MDIVILLLCHGILLQKFLEAGILPLGILHLHTGGVDASLCDAYAGLCGVDAACCAARPPFGACEVSLGLSQTQAELRILDDNKRVALPHLLELRKTHLADEALHAAVLWHNVLAHTGIVCHFATTEIHELADCINATTDDAYDNDSIINIG